MTTSSPTAHPARPDGSGSADLSRRSLLGRGAAVAGAAAVATLTSGGSSAQAAQTGSRHTSVPPDAATPDYLGYRRVDHAKPYAKYFRETTAPVLDNIRAALTQPPAAPADIPSLAGLAVELNTPGYSKIETGYGFRTDGGSSTNWSAAYTPMPGCTPEMWDWWFGWHSLEPARYKLWHPEAHLHASLLSPLADEPYLTDKEKYIGNTSYADEYLPDYYGARRYVGDQAGGLLIAPGITFVDPASIGVDISRTDGTTIVGRGGNQGEADTITLFAHQVRRTKTGCEMRSRFYVDGVPATAVRPADAQAVADAKARAPLPVAVNVMGYFNMLHAGQEMNHLAQFLPALYREFSRSRKSRG